MAKRSADIETVGNVPVRHALGYRAVFLESVTEDDVRGITKAVLARAKEGDLAAARLILDRVLGINAVADWPSRGRVEESARLDEMLGLTGKDFRTI
jgi:hypothetical protein